MSKWLRTLREAQRIKETKSGGWDGPYGGQVNTGSTDSEQADINTYGGIRKVGILQPYISSNSWIRVNPESGTSVVLQHRADTKDPQIVGYEDRKTDQRITDYKAGLGFYRPLREGEIDIMSKGGGNLFLSDRGSVEIRGGPVVEVLSKDKLEISSKAPLMRRALHLNKPGELGDEERLGVVKRWGKDATTPSKIFEYNVNSVEDQGEFSQEKLLILKNRKKTFVDIRVGEVFDDKGLPVQSLKTGSQLRLKQEFRNRLDTGSFTTELDVDGNLSVTLPDSAKVGTYLKIPAGFLEIEVGLFDTSIQCGRNFTSECGRNFSVHASKRISLVAEAGIEVKSSTQNVSISAVSGSLLASGTTSLALSSSGPVAVGGSVIILNNGVKPSAGIGDAIWASPWLVEFATKYNVIAASVDPTKASNIAVPIPGLPVGIISSGSPTVLV